MNRNSRAKNSPIVPKNVAQSQTVGVIHAPRRRQEVAVQAGDDDHVALQPHADVDDQRRSTNSSSGVACARAGTRAPAATTHVAERSASSRHGAYGPSMRLIMHVLLVAGCRCTRP